MEHCIQKDRLGKLEDKTNKFCKFQGETETNIQNIYFAIKDIRDNHLKHINQKINGLLFSVLVSFIVAIIIGAVKVIGQ